LTRFGAGVREKAPLDGVGQCHLDVIEAVLHPERAFHGHPARRPVERTRGIDTTMSRRSSNWWNWSPSVWFDRKECEIVEKIERASHP